MLRHAIKTAAAVALTILLYRLLPPSLLDRSDQTWAAVSAIIVMQSNLGGSFKASLNRIAGTALGALIGMVFAQLLGCTALPVAVAAGLTVWLCSRLGLQESLRLGGATAVLVMLAGREAGPWATGLHRFFDIAVGIGVALVTQLVVLPSPAGRQLQQGVAQALTEIGQLYEGVAGAYLRGDYPQQAIEKRRDAVRQTLRRNEALLRDIAHEPFGRHPRAPLWVALAGQACEVRDPILALDRAARLARSDGDFRELEPRLGELVAVSAAAFRWLAEAVAQAPAGPAPDLKAAVAAADDAFARLRQVQPTREFRVEEVLPFCTFFFTLRNVARDLDLMAARFPAHRPKEETAR
ncbi:MAG TPA: FUSC family protein [Gemmataceae bacterium]|nr:FUSC family protein [Gemmataceae bacterium]